jgi:hypothetical protein
MNASRGIFDQSPSADSISHANPFSFAAEAPARNPFSAAPLAAQSPFAAIPDAAQDRGLPEPGKPAKIPAPRPKSPDSPFQIAGHEGNTFGYEAPAPSPFSVATHSQKAADPIQTPMPVPQNPFSIRREDPLPAPVAPPQADWPQPAALANQPQPFSRQLHEESSVYRQLELRAIFGVDREMSGEEILQRARALPGIRHIAHIASHDVISLENLKRSLQTLGFGNGNLRLYSGNVPIEFVREGNITLAVQTDGGFAPGIRETIMIVARELDKMTAASA